MYLGDYHTHTTLSHGTGSIEDNVIAAIKAGLKEIAITDHGFGHVSYAVKRRSFDAAKKEVALLRKKYPQINIMLGLECNLISGNGDMDLLPGEADKLDITVCGFHKMVKTDLKSAFGFCLPGAFGIKSKRAVVRNTDAYVRLIEKNRVDIISHVNYAIKADAAEVARACKHFGTCLELNGKRVSLSDKELEAVAATGVNFIVNSDAHSPERVGDTSVPSAVIERLGIPKEQIVNFDKIPSFRSRKQQ